MANTKVTGNLIASGTITADNLVSGTLDTLLNSYLTTNTYATQSYVTTAINNLIDAAPASLDTLNELAAALNDDANFATTVTNSLATKLNLSGGTLTGDLSLTSSDIYINSGTSYNNSGAVYLSNQRSAIISNIVDLTANGDTSLDFQTRSGGTTSSSLFIDEFKRVGIGNTSPSSYYADNLVVSAGNNGGITIASSNTTNYTWLSFADGTTGNEAYRGLVGYYHTDDSMRFYTSGSEKIRIDSSGNLGIGNDAPTAKLDIQASGTFSFDSNDQDFSRTHIILRSGVDVVNQVGGGIVWTRPSGRKVSAITNYFYGDTDQSGINFYTQPSTSGSAASLVEAMRLDNSGNLGIGTNNPLTKLEVFGAPADSSSGNISLNTTATSGASRIAFRENSSNVGQIAYSHDNNQVEIIGQETDSKISLMTGGFNERLLIKSTGTIQLPYASDTGALNTGSGVITDPGTYTGMRLYGSGDGNFKLFNLRNNSAYGNIIFYTGTGTERMRITDIGALQVGGTNRYLVGTEHLIQGSSSSPGQGAVMVYNDTGTASCPALTVAIRDESTDTTARFIQFYSSVGGVAVQAMGGIVGNGATNVQFVSLSDEREKENIVEISGSLDKIMQIQVSEFDLIKTGEHVNAGFIAQNVENVFPEYVVENIANQGEEPRKGITGGMSAGYIAHLTKAIQELKAEIETLKSQINA